MVATYESFSVRVKELLEETAAGKDYNQTGTDGPNELYDFVSTIAGGPGHALGEIIYKVKRYAAKGNEEDLLKIAAWAFLVWRTHSQSEGFKIGDAQGDLERELAGSSPNFGVPRTPGVSA